jgi:uncharacterized protein with HEPN domain
MKRSIRLRFQDILTNIEIVQKVADGKTYEEFKADILIKLAIQRGIEIISEASKHIPEELRHSQPQIPWRNIAGIGNVLRHDYEDVADEIVWNVVRLNLPPLQKAVTAMLAALPDNE